METGAGSQEHLLHAMPLHCLAGTMHTAVCIYMTQDCQFETILAAKWIFLLHVNFNLALKLIQTGNLTT